MLVDGMFIAAALGLLFVGAESLVRGSEALAGKAGLSPLAIGLTVVAFGTSSPELVVSIQSGLDGQGDIALGNVVGSNIFNIAVILGLTALICPIPVHHQILKLDGPLCLGITLLLVLLLSDQFLGRAEGVLLLAGIIGYTWFNLRAARRETTAETDLTASVDAEPTAKPAAWSKSLILIVAGLAALVLGSHWLVKHAVSLATQWGVSEAVIGLTIIAAGTSMPELATSVMAAWRRQPDIAIGNVVGSNVFNILGILGVSSLITPLSAGNITMLDYAAMIFFAVALLPLLYSGRRLSRIEGGLLLALYAGYLALLWPA